MKNSSTHLKTTFVDIVFPSDDPWNQTAADNAEWLRRFKKEVGILDDPDLPGLPQGPEWSISQGGTGFAPPYLRPNPKAQVMPFDQNDTVSISLHSEAKPFEAESAAANKFLESLATRSPPAAVFCSRELENALSEFVTIEVTNVKPFPGDDALRAKAREVIGMPNTAADDPVLLGKFKDMMREKLGMGQVNETTTAQLDTTSAAAAAAATLPLDMDITLPEGGDLTDILQDMDFDFGDGSQAADPILGGRFSVM